MILLFNQSTITALIHNKPPRFEIKSETWMSLKVLMVCFYILVGCYAAAVLVFRCCIKDQRKLEGSSEIFKGFLLPFGCFQKSF